jgi:hypothetical protein
MPAAPTATISALSPDTLNSINMWLAQRRATGQYVSPLEMEQAFAGALKAEASKLPELERLAMQKQQIETQKKQWAKEYELKKEQMDRQAQASSMMGIGTIGMIANDMGLLNPLKKGVKSMWPSLFDDTTKKTTDAMPSNIASKSAEFNMSPSLTSSANQALFGGGQPALSPAFPADKWSSLVTQQYEPPAIGGYNFTPSDTNWYGNWASDFGTGGDNWYGNWSGGGLPDWTGLNTGGLENIFQQLW